ncbi:hypothetical protein VTO42DRAFT_8372 [Malbranchea cinnamomea]
MRFGKTLKASKYPPWKDHYIDYQKLKHLLREHETERPESEGGAGWTEEDEETFVQELVNVQLDKVNAFQVETYKQIRARTSECEARLQPLVVEGEDAPVKDENEKKAIAKRTLEELNEITRDVSELEKFSRLNFTGFLKAAKKHDRKRGARYRVRPLLQVRLSQLPFNSEDYSPVLYRLSAMYSFVRQILQPESDQQLGQGPSVDAYLGEDDYVSHKFWVHADNILEVKAFILRHLPVLVYNPSTLKELDVSHKDPTITSLYFDTPRFDLYSQKVARAPGASSLRLRWTGKLKDKPDIFFEKKTLGDGDRSREVRIRVKEKYIQSFLSGDYKMEKILHRMESQENRDQEVAILRHDIEEIQNFIRDNNLKPMVRATYTRAAFQIPGDDRIRISLDTDLALIREDSLDPQHPCRDPNDWHRRDIDEQEMVYPYSDIKDCEISRFPHALLDIKIRGTGNRANKEWIADLMSSHLVKEAPRFSKFVHGVAQLFEDQVNSFPFWLSDLDVDIRRDPEVAFQEEQDKMAKRAEEEMAVGSFLGRNQSPSMAQRPVESPITRIRSEESVPSEAQPGRRPSRPRIAPIQEGREPSPTATEPVTSTTASTTPAATTNFRSFIPKLSMSRYARYRRQPSAPLPPGVQRPRIWIKNAGPVRVEAKVWLANQRTFIKWQHICVLLAVLSLGLYNAAGPQNPVGRALAIVYTCFAIFAGGWGWFMYIVRSRLIRARSGKDLDNVFGPFVICIGLSVALVLNFWLRYASSSLTDDVPAPNPVPNPAPTSASHMTVALSSPSGDSQETVFRLVDQAGFI